jgi:isopenicillin-N epimerase
MQPLVVSWWQDDGFPSAVEFAGTLDYTAWLAAPTALDLLRDLDVEVIRRHNADLAAYAQRAVAAALDLDPAGLPTPSPEPSTVSMRLVPLPPGFVDDGSAATALASRIATELRCEVPVYVWQGRGMLRLSAQIYNRPEEYERLAAGLGALWRA